MTSARTPPTPVGKLVKKAADECGVRVIVSYGFVMFPGFISAKSRLWKDIENIIHTHASESKCILFYRFDKKTKFTRCDQCFNEYHRSVRKLIWETKCPIVPEDSVIIECKSLSRLLIRCLDFMKNPPRPKPHEGCKTQLPIAKNTYFATLNLDFERVSVGVDVFTCSEVA